MKKNLSIFMTAGSWLQRALALFLCVAALEAVQAAPQDTKRTITGTVVDQNNLPVAGATVMVSNTSNGTATDSNGQFSLSGVTDNDELQISFLGYKTVAMQVGTRTSIAATLEEDSGYLDEVVVVGYGTTTRRHIISAVSTVKSEAIENRPVANIQQALQGAAANLIIQTKNFNPTDNQMNISIRGVNTMGNNTPLVVIDGVVGGDLSNVSPDDIASIDVLKDGSAAAIYGTRGTNGVILVTTKKAHAGENRIEFSAYVAMQSVDKKPDVMSASEYRNTIRQYFPDKASSYDFGGSTDWFDAVTRKHPVSQNYNVSSSGGSAKLNYRASVSYTNDIGLVKKTGNEKLRGRLNVSQSLIRDRLKSSSCGRPYCAIRPNPFTKPAATTPSTANTSSRRESTTTTPWRCSNNVTTKASAKSSRAASMLRCAS